MEKEWGIRVRVPLIFREGGLLHIERTNSDGRFELQLRQNGRKMPSFKRKYDPVYRVLRVSCDAKVDEGEHTLDFVLKNEESDRILAREARKVANKDWAKVECYLEIPTTVDVYLRIDDKEVSRVPSKVYFRNLKVVEEK